MKVSEVMHRGIDFVPPGCTVREAARRMRRQNVGALAVKDKNVVTGVVTDRDLVVRVLAAGLDPARTRVASVMTPDPASAYDEADLDVVARMMEARRIRRILVVNRHERLIGMLTIDDLSRRGPARDLLGEVLESAAARHA